MTTELEREAQAALAAIGNALDMAQVHDPQTGFCKDVNSAQLCIALRPAFANLKRALDKTDKGK